MDGRRLADHRDDDRTRAEALAGDRQRVAGDARARAQAQNRHRGRQRSATREAGAAAGRRDDDLPGVEAVGHRQRPLDRRDGQEGRRDAADGRARGVVEARAVDGHGLARGRARRREGRDLRRDVEDVGKRAAAGVRDEDRPGHGGGRDRRLRGSCRRALTLTDGGHVLAAADARELDRGAGERLAGERHRLAGDVAERRDESIVGRMASESCETVVPLALVSEIFRGDGVDGHEERELGGARDAIGTTSEPTLRPFSE